ncbi:ribosome-inactivating family protein [Streptomyces sp. NPDC058304]|uniref:ribosome-inactivating family protein n=1 Tax=Streptomyces sp. NPDC058304 TaxID=3346437 RepID=UPI0036E9A3E0
MTARPAKAGIARVWAGALAAVLVRRRPTQGLRHSAELRQVVLALVAVGAVTTVLLSSMLPPAVRPVHAALELLLILAGLGVVAAVVRHPHEVDTERVVLRTGFLGDVTLPRSSVRSAATAIRTVPGRGPVVYASADEYRLLASTIRSRAVEARDLRGRAGYRTERVHHLPVRIQLRGLFVELCIELRVRNSDLRIAGFRNTFENWQAPPEARFRHVRDSVAPPRVRRAEALAFGGEPSALETAAGVRRSGLHLGRRPMINAVIRLHRNSDPKCTAHALLVLTEMICEAGRSPVPAEEMSGIWMTGGPLPATTRSVA